MTTSASSPRAVIAARTARQPRLKRKTEKRTWSEGRVSGRRRWTATRVPVLSRRMAASRSSSALSVGSGGLGGLCATAPARRQLGAAGSGAISAARGSSARAGRLDGSAAGSAAAARGRLLAVVRLATGSGSRPRGGSRPRVRPRRSARSCPRLESRRSFSGATCLEISSTACSISESCFATCSADWYCSSASGSSPRRWWISARPRIAARFSGAARRTCSSSCLRFVETPQLEQRTAERDVGGQVCGVPLKASLTGRDRFFEAAGAAVLFREGRERDRRRVHLDPAFQFFNPRAVRHQSLECTTPLFFKEGAMDSSSSSGNCTGTVCEAVERAPGVVSDDERDGVAAEERIPAGRLHARAATCRRRSPRCSSRWCGPERRGSPTR